MSNFVSFYPELQFSYSTFFQTIFAFYTSVHVLTLYLILYSLHCDAAQLSLCLHYMLHFVIHILNSYIHLLYTHKHNVFTNNNYFIDILLVNIISLSALLPFNVLYRLCYYTYYMLNYYIYIHNNLYIYYDINIYLLYYIGIHEFDIHFIYILINSSRAGFVI